MGARLSILALGIRVLPAAAPVWGHHAFSAKMTKTTNDDELDVPGGS